MLAVAGLSQLLSGQIRPFWRADLVLKRCMNGSWKLADNFGPLGIFVDFYPDPKRAPNLAPGFKTNQTPSTAKMVSLSDVSGSFSPANGLESNHIFKQSVFPVFSLRVQ